MCCGHALVVVGDARAEFYRCRDRGVLAQFRHQHFMLFLIAHVQKASLLMFSDRLVDALKRLDVTDPESVKQFKRAIRSGYAAFLRFTHRYWFHEVSEQAQVRALFRMCTAQLGLDPLYAEVKERMHDMNAYLDADSLRRQANTVVRLTVVTIFGLVGTVTTGFLGMNLLAMGDSPMLLRVLAFAVVFAGTVGLTMYTIGKSKRLSDFLDVLSEEGLSWRVRFAALVRVWGRPGNDEGPHAHCVRCPPRGRSRLGSGPAPTERRRAALEAARVRRQRDGARLEGACDGPARQRPEQDLVAACQAGAHALDRSQLLSHQHQRGLERAR